MIGATTTPAPARLHSVRRPTTVALMLTFFVDESGTDGHSHVMTMAGWLIRSEKLRLFERNWQRELTTFGVTEAKASAMAIRKGEFADWSEGKIDQFRHRLGRVIRDYAWRGVEFSIVAKDYERVVAEMLPKRTVYRDPYIFALQCLLEKACGVDQLRGRDRIGCIFDEGHPYPGRTERSFFELLDGTDTKMPCIQREYRTADSKLYGGLQAADLLAWAARRGTIERVTGITPGFSTLHGIYGVPADRISGGYVDEAGLRSIFARALTPGGPDGE